VPLEGLFRGGALVSFGVYHPRLRSRTRAAGFGLRPAGLAPPQDE
jgi:hypothetical protein